MRFLRSVGVFTWLACAFTLGFAIPPPAIQAGEIRSPSLTNAWIVPGEQADAEPYWGIKDGIAVGLWPLSGPRGLLRIYTPYLGQERLRMLNLKAAVGTGQIE